MASGEDSWWVRIAIGILKGVSIIYDCITYVPTYFIDLPSLKVRRSDRIKARRVDEGNPSSPWRSVDSFNVLTTSLFPECETLDDLIVRAVKLYGPNHSLGTRQLLSEEDELQPNGRVFKKLVQGVYTWETYETIYQRALHVGSGLRALGQEPRNNICIYAETRADWLVCAIACFIYNFPVVTLYSTLGEEAVLHGVHQSEVSIIITSSDLLSKFKNMVARLPNVRHIVYMESPLRQPNIKDFGDTVQIHSLSSLQTIGAQPEHLKKPIVKPQRSDLALIMYTSGSQGIPKGVLITHGNVMCGMSGQCQRIPGLCPDDIYIAYLPLAHVLELTAEFSCWVHGVRIGYATPLTITDNSSKVKKGTKGDCSMLRPTLMASVPVIMERIYKTVWEKVNEGGALQSALFRFAYEYKRKNLSRGYHTPLCNRLIFGKVKQILGGRVRMMLSGAAPLSQDTQYFMNICFCCPVGQGYGLTETCGAGSIQEATDLSTKRVGAPLQCNEIMLVDWEEGGYMSTNLPNPQGEIWIGGGNVTQGYYKNAEMTEIDFKVINGQRWFCTGDIGEFESDGCLRIIDRKKDLVKYSGGEYVSLGKVETTLKLAPIVDNICVYADPSRDYAVCLVVANPKKLAALAAYLQLEYTHWTELCDNPRVEQEVLKQLTQMALLKKLEKFEIPQRVKLCQEIWTPDMDFLTDSFKLKRRNIAKFYAKEITRMYA